MKYCTCKDCSHLLILQDLWWRWWINDQPFTHLMDLSWYVRIRFFLPNEHRGPSGFHFFFLLDRTLLLYSSYMFAWLFRRGVCWTCWRQWPVKGSGVLSTSVTVEKLELSNNRRIRRKKKTLVNPIYLRLTKKRCGRNS